jgi:DNA-binding PadR family transcriptional regulator
VSLNSTSAVILGLLHDGAATGADLVNSAQRRLVAQGGVTRSQVYRELPQLVRDGLVEAGQAGGRASQPYTITPSGRDAFAAWATGPVAVDTVRSSAVLRLVFGSLLKAPQRRRIVAQAIAEHELALAEHEQRAAELNSAGDRFAASAAEFAVAYERAFLGWLRAFPA